MLASATRGGDERRDTNSVAHTTIEAASRSQQRQRPHDQTQPRPHCRARTHGGQVDCPGTEAADQNGDRGRGRERPRWSSTAPALNRLSLAQSHHLPWIFLHSLVSPSASRLHVSACTLLILGPPARPISRRPLLPTPPATVPGRPGPPSPTAFCSTMAGKLAWQSLALATTLASVSYAQQYQGTTSANTLPDVSGASIEFFRIQDQENQNATLIVSTQAHLPLSQSSRANNMPTELLFSAARARRYPRQARRHSQHRLRWPPRLSLHGRPRRPQSRDDYKQRGTTRDRGYLCPSLGRRPQ